MATKGEIFNRALSLNASNLLSDENDTSNEGVVCRTHYPQIYKGMLSAFDWSFAKTSTGQLTKLAGGDTNDQKERYQIPTDALTIKRVYTKNGFEIPYRVDGDEIITEYDIDTTSGVYLDYIQEVDEGVLPAYFVDALVYRLAAEICLPLTENQTGYSNFYTVAQDMLKTAKFADRKAGGTKSLADSGEYSMVRQRYSGYSNWGR